MSQSFPSKPVIGIDVPEVRQFGGRFVYSYHVADERVDDSGDIPESILEIPVGSFGQDYIDKFASRVPRFVLFDIRPVILRPRFNSRFSLFFLNAGGEKTTTSIAENISKIHSEREFSNAAFTALGFQDTGIDGKLFLITSGTLAKRVNSKNEIVKRRVDKELQDVVDAFDSNRISMQDAAKFLAGDTGNDISNDFIVDSLNNLSRLGAIFIDAEKQEAIIDQRFDEIKRVDLKMKINNKIVSKALKTSLTDPLSIFVDELQPLLPQAEEVQTEAIHAEQPGTIDANEYDIIINYLKRRKVSASAFQPTAKVIGYIIDKHEITEGNQVVRKQRIITENPLARTVTDFKVAYGATYAYSIKTIAEVEFLVTDGETDDFYAATVLVSSSPSPRIIVTCTENVPPPPPADFNVSWDYNKRRPRLMWCFPTNTQRDIKYWQIFRRASINEPFQLLKVYDFDNSEIKTPGFEQVNPSLIEKLNSPKNFYIDEEFSKDSKAIYAVCAVDAHGLTSNYSTQFEVSFDRYSNKIIKKLVSTSGAPKPYPNMNLNQDTFVDVMKDSGHSRVTIYFDPEYLRLSKRVGSKQEDVKLITTLQGGSKYRMQFINLDLQKSADLDILVDDRTEELIADQRPQQQRDGQRRHFNRDERQRFDPR